jgi:queuine tRNA-ribosyltransferase
MKFEFKIIHRSKKSRARVGKIYTPHGEIDTPHFVAVGTHATIKAIDTISLESLGVQLLFCNTYHLMLHPGTKVIEQAGGLHRFMGRTKPIITDSGGFQVFSLAYGGVHDELKSKGMKKNGNCVLKVTEEGVFFRSYRDGTKFLLSPESSIAAQKQLGADIIIPLDELPPYHIEKANLKECFDRTHRWEIRSLNAHHAYPKNQAIYGVIHGGIDKELRAESCKILTDHPFDGFAIGGSVGKNKQELRELIQFTTPLLPERCPTHLLGIGDLNSLFSLIPLGIDTFDSSYPTKAARHGHLFTKQGRIKIENTFYKTHFEPCDPMCACFTCKHFTCAYLHHLFKASELSAYTLASLHNLHFMCEMMRATRELILEDKI